MYTKLHSIPEAELTKILALRDEVTFTLSTGSRRRNGVNPTEKLSMYEYSKWFTWTHAQRQVVRSVLGEPLTRKSQQLYFLNIPAKTGFLDTMDYWVGKEKMCGKIAAYALEDNMTIYIDSRAVKLMRGEGIYFCLSELHRIDASKAGQKWLCTMTRSPVSELK